MRKIAMKDEDKINILNYAYDYRWGTLWFGAEEFIRERFDSWNAPGKGKKERKGHPLLSLCKRPVTALCDQVPMLAGTSQINRCNHPSLLIQTDKDHVTDFGTVIESYLIFAEDLLFHEDDPAIDDDPETPVWERRTMWPNREKKRITEEENEALLAFLTERKKVAFQNGGYNK